MSLGFLSAGELYSLSCAFIWAIAVILFRVSGERTEPVALNLFKNAVGLLLFVVTLPLIGVPFLPDGTSTADLVALTISGVVGIGIADSLFFASLNRLGAGNTAIVDSLYSPFVILCAFVYLHEPIGAKVLASMALMTAAILVGTWEPSLPKGSEERKRVTAGILLGVLGVFLMAIGLVIVKPVLEHADAWWVATMRLVAGTAFLAIQGFLPRHRASVLAILRPSRAWRVAVPAGIIGCYLAMITWIAGMKLTLASIASVLNQTSTLFVVLFAAVVLKERLTWRRGAAVAMAFVGAVLVSC
jgi:drug/metabolite transporter (DMT)-like permease